MHFRIRRPRGAVPGVTRELRWEWLAALVAIAGFAGLAALFLFRS